jgi:TatD DNase family protein
VEVSQKYSGVYASVGLHPTHLHSTHVNEEESSFKSREEDFDYDYYKTLAKHDQVIGIGECGLDLYHLPESVSKEQVLEKQKKVFLQHIKLAKELGLALIVHCRDAHDQMVEFLRQHEAVLPTKRGTIHCYTSDYKHAREYINLGFYIGFTGIVTFPPIKSNPQAQTDLLETVKKIPLDKILLETDCPYLSPIPYRGKRGEPWMVEATAAKIAEIRDTFLKKILSKTSSNAKELFGI